MSEPKPTKRGNLLNSLLHPMGKDTVEKLGKLSWLFRTQKSMKQEVKSAKYERLLPQYLHELMRDISKESAPQRVDELLNKYDVPADVGEEFVQKVEEKYLMNVVGFFHHLHEERMNTVREKYKGKSQMGKPQPNDIPNLVTNTNNDQDEYDIEEISDDLHRRLDVEEGTEHHLELEIKPQCDIHGSEYCECPVLDSDGEEFNDGASYNFTFEYDENGKLVPTYSDVEDKFLDQHLDNNTPGKITEITGKKKSKKKKKKKKTKPPSFDPDSFSNCLFCDYEAIFGEPPKQLLKLYNKKVADEEKKREHIRKKLQAAKQNAIKKQKEMRENRENKEVIQ